MLVDDVLPVDGDVPADDVPEDDVLPDEAVPVEVVPDVCVPVEVDDVPDWVVPDVRVPAVPVDVFDVVPDVLPDDALDVLPVEVLAAGAVVAVLPAGVDDELCAGSAVTVTDSFCCVDGSGVTDADTAAAAPSIWSRRLNM